MAISNSKMCAMIEQEAGELSIAGYLQVNCWPQDSIYSVLSRFAIANGLSDFEIERLFKSKAGALEGTRFAAGLETFAVVDIKAAAALLGIGHAPLHSLFLRALPIYRGITISPYLRYCPICIGAQRHFVFFQRESLARCPFHRAILLNHCRACGVLLNYAWGRGLFNQPYACPHCEVPLAGEKSQRCFYDLLTSQRESLLGFYSLAGVEDQFCRRPEQVGCPGFLVALPKVSPCDFRNLDALPLRELREAESNWQVSAGYVQLRSQVSAHQRHNYPDSQDENLIPCLKSILRHIRKIWKVRELSPGLHSTELVLDGDSRLCAFKYFHTYWIDFLKPQKTMRSVRQVELDGCCTSNQKVVPTEVAHWPPASRAWYTRHKFIDCVLDSLSRCIEASTWSADVDVSMIMEYISAFARPLWPVEFIDAEGRVSYRILRHQRFWNGMLDSKNASF